MVRNVNEVKGKEGRKNGLSEQLFICFSVECFWKVPVISYKVNSTCSWGVLTSVTHSSNVVKESSTWNGQQKHYATDLS